MSECTHDNGFQSFVKLLLPSILAVGVVLVGNHYTQRQLVKDFGKHVDWDNLTTDRLSNRLGLVEMNLGLLTELEKRNHEDISELKSQREGDHRLIEEARADIKVIRALLEGRKP